MEVNVDGIIKLCQSGQLKDIAKSGHVPCYEIDDDFVLIVRSSNTAENSKKLMELSLKGIKDVCSVVDYRVIGKNCYEIQKRARGEHFRTDETKQRTIDKINQSKRVLLKAQERLNKNPNDFNKKIVVSCLKDIKAYEIYMDSKEYKSLKYDTRKDELMARYSMIMKMPTQHIKDFFETIMQLSDNKMSYDSSGNNLLYDEGNGFSVIDLSEEINGEENFSNILNASNYYTMVQLLGTNKIKEVPSEEHEMVIEAMRESLKKIVTSIIDLEYDGKKISLEQIQESLSTYKQYGIDLSVNEILEDKNKNEEYIITLGEIGKGTVNIPIKTKDEPEQRVTINEKSIEKQEKYKSVIKKIAQVSGKNVEDVRKDYDEIIMTNNVNRDGEELYLLRRIVSEEILKGMGIYKNKGRYSIYTKDGEFAGFIDATISNTKKANKAEIEYKTVEKQRNKGNITISLEEVLKDIFINHSFDNLTIRDIFPTTNIEEVFLNINDDNYASQAVARKKWIQKNGNIHTMTRERFLELMKERFFSPQEIGRSTINVPTEEKFDAKRQIETQKIQQHQIDEK